MKKFKHFTAIISLVCIFAFLIGCGDAATVPMKFDENFEVKKASSFTAAENDKYALMWDSENKRILLKDLVTGRIWSNVPKTALEPRYDSDGDLVSNNAQLEAPIIVEYIDPETTNLRNLNGYTGSLKKNNYSIEKTDGGFTLTYYFEKEQISVPVTYTLGDGYISVSVDPTKVTENEKKIYSVSVSPFFCGIENGSGGYLFIPSGSGAVIYANEELEATRSYSASVYGDDLERYPLNQLKSSVKESVYLPVFGAVSADGEGVCGIITSGEGSASVELNYGNINIGYSTVYPKFELRGYQNATAKITTYKFESRVYADSLASTKAEVRFYPLNSNNSSLTGMADVYRDYLFEKYDMKEENSDSLLNIKILGGAQIKKSFLGVPYSTLYAATTTQEVQSIIDSIQNVTGEKPNVELVGFGKSGTDISKLAGGYTVNNKLGGTKGMTALSNWCKENDIPLYFDFDLISYAKSGNGFSTMFDSAQAVNRRTTYQKTYSIGTKSAVISKGSYSLIKRSLIKKSAEKAFDALEKMSLDGVALGSISANAYSDYTEQQYYSKGNIAKDINEVINSFSGKKVLVNSANDYAAAGANAIFDVPTTSSKEVIFDCDVPFYQMVFKGYKPMSSASINLAPDADDLLLRCAETGLGLQYTLTQNYSIKLKDNTDGNFYATVYDDMKPYIENAVNSYKECFNQLQNAKIVGYEIISKDVRKTVFDNGTAVWVNYGSEAYSSEVGEIPAGEYKLVKEAERQ